MEAQRAQSVVSARPRLAIAVLGSTIVLGCSGGQMGVDEFGPFLGGSGGLGSSSLPPPEESMASGAPTIDANSAGFPGIDASVSHDATPAGCPAGSVPDATSPGGCRTGLLLNPSFERGTGSWRAEMLAAQAFDLRDAPRSDQVDPLAGTSGSLSVTNLNTVEATEGMAMAGSSQCARVLSAGYEVAAQILLPDGQGAAGAGIGILFFESNDCSGRASGVFASPVATATDVWTLVRGSTQAPTTARSLSMRLLVRKPFAQSAVTALFDNVLLGSGQ